MRNAPRSEGHLAGTDVKLVIANLNDMLAFEHVPEFVLILVNVKRRVEGVYLLNNPKNSSGRIGRRPDDELCSAERDAFTGIRVDFEAASGIHVGNCNAAALIRPGSSLAPNCSSAHALEGSAPIQRAAAKRSFLNDAAFVVAQAGLVV